MEIMSIECLAQGVAVREHSRMPVNDTLSSLFSFPISTVRDAKTANLSLAKNGPELDLSLKCGGTLCRVIEPPGSQFPQL